MTRDYDSKQTLQQKIMKGVDVLADNVASTLGPKGRNVLLQEKGKTPFITKDGVTVAHFVALEDPFENAGAQIIKQVAEGIKKTSPNAFVICITNPLDVIVMALQKYSGLPTNKVIGMAGILDTSRFKYFLSQELKVPVKSVKSLVLGGHGDTMVPMPNQTKVDGKPLDQLIKKEKLDQIIERTRTGGGEINKLFQNGSAFYAPAASGIEMAESYIKNLKKTLPCAAYLNGEYGVKNLYAGVPVKIGKKGVEKIIEINLSDLEKKQFNTSIEAVQKLFNVAIKIDPELKK